MLANRAPFRAEVLRVAPSGSGLAGWSSGSARADKVLAEPPLRHPCERSAAPGGRHRVLSAGHVNRLSGAGAEGHARRTHSRAAVRLGDKCMPQEADAEGLSRLRGIKVWERPASDHGSNSGPWQLCCVKLLVTAAPSARGGGGRAQTARLASPGAWSGVSRRAPRRKPTDNV